MCNNPIMMQDKRIQYVFKFHSRFGSKCLRIFRVLLLKKHLEQKQVNASTYDCRNIKIVRQSLIEIQWMFSFFVLLQIEDFVMISAKEAKDLLYTLFSENFITTTVSLCPCSFWLSFPTSCEIKNIWHYRFKQLWKWSNL